jgi:hypothetical protein
VIQAALVLYDREWSKALILFTSARDLYSKLAAIEQSAEIKRLYLTAVNEQEPSIRFCEMAGSHDVDKLMEIQALAGESLTDSLEVSFIID